MVEVRGQRSMPFGKGWTIPSSAIALATADGRHFPPYQADLVLHALGLGAYKSLAGLLLSDSPDGVSISHDLAFTV